MMKLVLLCLALSANAQYQATEAKSLEEAASTGDNKSPGLTTHSSADRENTAHDWAEPGSECKLK